MEARIPVGILGATGMVGQHFVKFLQNHPWFEITWFGASDRSAGKPYGEATSWRLDGVMPPGVAGKRVEECKPGIGAPRLVFSAMDASVATEIEREFAQVGHIIVSNSRNHRMEPDVPLLIPEVNPDHLKIIPYQQRVRGWNGQIATNPNCSTIVLAMALAPLKQFGIKRVVATTMQALSGAGYPGVASLDINANVVPFIGNEEEKMQQETQKILGDFMGESIQPLAAKVSAHCNRVPVVDGHMVATSVELERKPGLEEIIRALNSFRSVPQERNLPSAPVHPVQYMEAPDRPQPRRDVERDRGMAVYVGRLRECPALDYKFIALGHNTIRGAAGAAVLNAELMYSEGLLDSMIVMKFGGTSVESAEAIQRVAGIVKSRLDRKPVVVVSAMGKTTNRLLKIANLAVTGQRDTALGELIALRDYHLRESGMERTVDEHFQELSELVKGLAVLGELTPRSIDAISSFGERLSSLIVTNIFQHHGISAVHLDSRKVIVTDRRHTQAVPQLEQTYARLAAAISPLAKQHVVVMGGFIGATEDSVATTLGRGGSDFTASLVGAGIQADEIQIWTDVDGMLTADPNLVPGAHRVRLISFTEAAELAYFGAKVLHPATVMPAIDRNIPVMILNSRRPQVEGTRIQAEPVPSKNVIKSIACKAKVTVLNIRSTRMFMAHGFMRRIFEVFDRYATSVDMVATSEVSVSLTLDQTEFLEAIVGELREFADVSVDENDAIICIVGDNIRHTPGVAARVFNALKSINVRMLSQGASALNIGFVVTGQDLRAAVQALHSEFFSELDPAVFDA